MTMRKLIYYSGRYVFLLLVYLLPLLRNISSPNSIKENIGAYFVVNFGGIYPTKSIDIMTFIFYVIPNFVLIFVFSDIMREDCMINYIYVLTRNQKKQKWLFQKAFQLFWLVMIAYILLFVLAFIMAGTINLKLYGSGFNLFVMLTVIFFLNVLSMFFLIYLQNFLSLYYGSVQSFLYVILLYLISMVVALIFYNSGTVGNLLLELLIPTNQMYIWHSDVFTVQGAEIWLNNPLNRFTTASSVLILPVYILLEYGITRHIFLTRETFEMMKEA